MTIGPIGSSKSVSSHASSHSSSQDNVNNKKLFAPYLEEQHLTYCVQYGGLNRTLGLVCNGTSLVPFGCVFTRPIK